MTLSAALRLSLLALAVATLPAPVLADEEAEPSARFADARLKDDVRGVVETAGTPVHVEFYAPPGAKLSVKLRPDDDGDTETAADGLSLELCGPDGVLVPVAGTRADRSKPERDLVRWKKVELTHGGTYQLIVDASVAGGFRLQLAGQGGRQKLVEESDENLLPGERAELSFDGASGSKVKFRLKRRKDTTFIGDVVAVLRPDGSELVPEGSDPDVAKIVLDADGRHRLIFENGADTAGGWRSAIQVRAPRVRKRQAYVRADEVALVPKVQTVEPEAAFHRDTALDVVLTGRDFQPGADVRLTRKGRTDIVARDVDVVSETELRCVVNLDTREASGQTSVGTWTVSVFNAPVYANPDDVLTLVKDSLTSHRKKKLLSRSAGSITLPAGVRDDTEVWYVRFTDEFTEDLDRLGLGSEHVPTRDLARDVVEGYVVAYLRDLFGQNETNGNVGNGVPISFIVGEPPEVAGTPGVDYNLIDVGGGQREDLGDPDEAEAGLEWGFAPFDDGNQQREALFLHEDDGEGGTVRRGQGARIRFLDPSLGGADASWIAATKPLRDDSLRAADRGFFNPEFRPVTTVQATRYGDIVTAVERTAREVAAVVAHHVGRAMGLTTAGEGPMATPGQAGGFWPERDSLTFVTADLTTMRTNVVVHQLPGKSNRLTVNYFPLRSTLPMGSANLFAHLLPDLTTDVEYAADFGFVGGRPNAVADDYVLRYIVGSDVPFGLDRAFTGLTGSIDTLTNNGTLNCLGRPHLFQYAIEDQQRNVVWFSLFRLNALPNMAVVPTQLRAQAQTCTTAILNTP